MVRERLLRDLRDELPHSIAVSIDTIEEDDETWSVAGRIYVRRSSQKGIVIGHKGRRLRAVRRAAERELSEMYEREVTISLRVKVEKDWPRNFWMLKQLGYVE
jgi:GTP-binding protein Era